MEALFEQCGVIRDKTMQEMFELAIAFSPKKYPKGKRVAIVTNGGGPGIMAADACNSIGLEVPTFSDETQKALRSHLAPEASVTNPIDMIASGDPDEFENVLDVRI